MSAGHTFRRVPCALCGRVHRVTSVPKARVTNKPKLHIASDPEDVTTLAILRGVIRAYSDFGRSGYDAPECQRHDDAVRMAAEAIGEPFFGMADCARLEEARDG